MGLLDKAGKHRDNSGNETESSRESRSSESAAQSGATGLLQRASRQKEQSADQPLSFEDTEFSSSQSGGLLHRAEQTRTESADTDSDTSSTRPSGLLERAQQAREHPELFSSTRAPSNPGTSNPGSGSGLLNRARAMRDNMKGLLARASAMRQDEPQTRASSSAPSLQGSPFDSSPETDVASEFRSTDTSTSSDEFAGLSGDLPDFGDSRSDDSFETESRFDESVDLMDEDEFQKIAQEAASSSDLEPNFEPEISAEAMEDFQSPFDMHALDDMSDAEGFADLSDEATIAESAKIEASDFESESPDEPTMLEPDSSDDSEALSEFQDPERMEEPDHSEESEFPDLDLEYRASDEKDDPALESPDESEDQVDPFSSWEQEALEQAEQEAHGLQTSPVPDRDEGFLYEDTHPMTTLPAEAHIASQRKIDHYMALFDLLRELQDVQELEEFWESLSYAILGQLGASRVIIFASHESGKNELYYPVAYLGVTPGEWVLKPGDEIYDTLQKDSEIHYAQEFQKTTSTISDLEKEILESINAQIIAPIGQPGSNSGLIMLGPNMEGVDYTLDDLDYLRLLGEMSAGALQRIRQRMKRDEQSEQNQVRLELYERILSASREASQVKNLDDVYDVLLSHLKDDFGVESASLVLLNVPDQTYRIFAGNEISPESLEKFQLPVSSDLIGTVSNLTRLYDFADFRNDQEITSCYSNDDLALMQSYWIVPLINLNWLVGFVTIHRSRPWTEFDRELVLATAEFFAPILANCIILGERETLFRDPFSPVMERLRQELDRGAQFQTPVSLVEVRVKNLKRLLSLNEPDSVTSFLQDLSRSLGGLLFDSDFQARVGQGRFALILPGRNSQEADIFIRKVQAEFKRLNLLSSSPIDVQYSFQSVTAPEDAREPEKMLAYLDP